MRHRLSFRVRLFFLGLPCEQARDRAMYRLVSLRRGYLVAAAHHRHPLRSPAPSKARGAGTEAGVSVGAACQGLY
ncbi:hypothetical protein B0H14DRAFT_2969536 [Mycena olivaceomarginata]|nr:hypothetical protein B0H14DRAFT_2969536 [Mycena olivaceomarginata]